MTFVFSCEFAWHFASHKRQKVPEVTNVNAFIIQIFDNGLAKRNDKKGQQEREGREANWKIINPRVIQSCL